MMSWIVGVIVGACVILPVAALAYGVWSFVNDVDDEPED